MQLIFSLKVQINVLGTAIAVCWDMKDNRREGREGGIWISGRSEVKELDMTDGDGWGSGAFFPRAQWFYFNAPRTCLLWILTPTHLYEYSCIEIGTNAYFINTVDIWAWWHIDETDCLCLWPV